MALDHVDNLQQSIQGRNVGGRQTSGGKSILRVERVYLLEKRNPLKKRSFKSSGKRTGNAL